MDPAVLAVTAHCRPGGRFDPDAYRVHARRDVDQIERALVELDDGPLRLDIIAGTLKAGPVDLTVHLDASHLHCRREVALWRLFRACGHAFPRQRRSVGRDRRLPRLVEALRVADALAAGASLREIALGLDCPTKGAIDWPGDGEHVKSAIRRKVDLAHRLITAGPAAILNDRI